MSTREEPKEGKAYTLMPYRDPDYPDDPDLPDRLAKALGWTSHPGAPDKWWTGRYCLVPKDWEPHRRHDDLNIALMELRFKEGKSKWGAYRIAVECYAEEHESHPECWPPSFFLACGPCRVLAALALKVLEAVG